MGNLKGRKFRIIVVSILLVTLLTGCRGFINNDKLSDVIVGQWCGQVDVAKIVYKELGDDLGIELSPEPVYCDMYFEFDDDGTVDIELDLEGFAQAVGECVEPYTTAIFGFDTSSLVNIIMKYAAQEISAGTGEEQGVYEVDDEDMTVSITTESGETDELIMDDEGNLLYEDYEIDQIIVLEKQ